MDRYCGKCGAVIPVGNGFCAKCGTMVSMNAEVPSAAPQASQAAPQAYQTAYQATQPAGNAAPATPGQGGFAALKNSPGMLSLVLLGVAIVGIVIAIAGASSDSMVLSVLGYFVAVLSWIGSLVNAIIGLSRKGAPKAGAATVLVINICVVLVFAVTAISYYQEQKPKSYSAGFEIDDDGFHINW